MRHKLQLNINPVTGRMQTARPKILTCLINFKTNFVTLLLRTFVARDDGESGPTERRGSDRQTTQRKLQELACFMKRMCVPCKGGSLQKKIHIFGTMHTLNGSWGDYLCQPWEKNS